MKNYLIFICLFFCGKFLYGQEKQLTKKFVCNPQKNDVFYNLLSNTWDSITYEKKIYLIDIEDSIYSMVNRCIEVESKSDTTNWFYKDKDKKVIIQSTLIKGNLVFGHTTLFRAGKESTCYYDKGRKEGIQIYFVNGNKYFSFFKVGLKEGLELLFKNNTLYLASNFQNGMKNGKEIKFCESNKLAIEICVEYINGVLKNDLYIKYDCLTITPSIFELMVFKDNELFGLIPNFNKENELISISLHYKQLPIKYFSIH